ncbi:hypothetical protein ACKI1I_06900 [Streptomyces turgidiscabies]|uniref:Uncharacterized protein n=1 Tax=Streptomyces turgidiscabies (strain Car8) TaxID=698760 RepID=L7F027_STRT8|nr:MULTISPECIES: hypothetical protein [Streptomyces]ELP64602.1 hypothetical protein STRTUCAR8_09220 [Streptomyces turgidiscabies Car8]MDX3491546.1 hypothetical protein [Streptomyces turgidiscabies]GAQ73152.1 hypothetical protein T45_04908 [Streptomyces turgidiscabies]
MSKAARQAETDEVSAAFHVALTQIGAQTTAEALALWADVPVERRAATAGAWLRKAITLVMSRRRQSRDLARAYYRLARALQTGRTVADPYHPEPSYVTLADLRREFAELAGNYQPPAEQGGEAATVADGEASSARQVENDTPQDVPGQAPGSTSGQALDDEAGEVLEGAGTNAEVQDDEDDPDWERVLVEELEGLRAEEERVERQAEEELRIVLEALGTASLDRRMTLEDADPDEAHRQAGAQQAAAASRVAMNGGRSANGTHMSRDRRALGYVRLSRTGTPRAAGAPC